MTNIKSQYTKTPLINLINFVKKELEYSMRDSIIKFNNYIISEINPSNQNLPTEYIKDNINILRKQMNLLSANPNLTWDIIQDIPELSRCVHVLSDNPCITWDIVRDCLQSNINFGWDFKYLAMNQNITIDILLKNKNLGWNWRFLSYNPNITENDILMNPDIDWDWHSLRSHKNLSINFIHNFILPKIKDNSNFGIGLSFNPNLTWDYIYKNMNCISFNWDVISNHPNITWDIISKNRNMFCKLNNRRIWNWSQVSINPNITLEIVLKNPDILWNWSYFSTNVNVTMDIIRNNPKLPWDMYTVLKNPNLTFSFIIENFEHISNSGFKLDAIFYNRFNYDPFFHSEFYRKRETHKMINIIKEELISKACHPDRIYNWNEDFCTDYPEEYLKECIKWNNL